jgi:hypothetical protein
MKRIAFLTMIGSLLWSATAFGGPNECDVLDGDGVCPDNCYLRVNPAQDDTDGDLCGNLCDADYDNDGIVGFSDFGAFTANFGTTNELYNHTEPVTDTVGFGDFGFFSANFGSAPGPSDITPGTIACP